MATAIGTHLWSALSASLVGVGVFVALLVGVLTYRLFKGPGSSDRERNARVEEVPEEVQETTEGLFSFFADGASLFGQAVTTVEDIRVESGEVLYYLISGKVEIVENKKVLLVRETSFFLCTPEWMAGVPGKSPVSYNIRAKSVFYQISGWRDTSILHVLQTRMFRSTLYTLFNYLEVSPEEHDIKKVETPYTEDTDRFIAQMEKEKGLALGREVKHARVVDAIERFSSNTLVYVISGQYTVEYLHRKAEVGPGHLVGCISRTTFLVQKRKMACREKGLLLEITLSPYFSTDTGKLTGIVEEYLGKFPRLLQSTDALVDWRILAPGERISASLPTPAVKIISCGYFLKEGDVKYFGIGSGRVLFEREILLGLPAPYIAIASRVSEIIEVPSEYITLVMGEFQHVAIDLYKRILFRTGAEEELDPPRIISFLPNDPQATQVEVFVHFLGMEINKYDKCAMLSSEELKKELDLPASAQVPSSIRKTLLQSSLLEEFSYVLFSLSSEAPSSAQGDPSTDLDLDLDLALSLSEIIFYLTVNGHPKDLELKKVWCKVDTVILHRDSKRKVQGGVYYGQRHHVEFPAIDIPVSAIKQKTHRSAYRERKTHCTFTESTGDSYLPTFPTKDLERFLRTLKGENVGLVLGGGGARGLAHIGIIQALEEEGIPIDAVGGTSMGAFVGALYAERCNNKDVFVKSKRLCMLIASVWRVLLDVTYPICSLFTGKSFNWGLKLIFKSRKIEDMWLPYYCVTTDISAFEERTHTFGLIWRYVRASMSLSGYLPPLCDGTSLLLDGGYVNNVPADAMRLMGIRNIIAVDVGSEVESNYDNYGDSLNGFYILFQKLFGTKRFLSLTEIQYRLAYIASAHKERSLKSDISVKYIRPDLAGYKTMNFRQFDEIVAHGYQHGKKVIKEWKKTKNYAEFSFLGKRKDLSDTQACHNLHTQARPSSEVASKETVLSEAQKNPSTISNLECNK
ncbi:lysophospholipid hydrolase [Nematocida sp. AWRm77]|nr:lysophospholipid hydrolase [Nematocida sp. AWRm77]